MLRLAGHMLARPFITTYLVLVVLYARTPRRRRDAKDMLRLFAERDRTR